jgi:hypothetical protein
MILALGLGITLGYQWGVMDTERINELMKDIKIFKTK